MIMNNKVKIGLVTARATCKLCDKICTQYTACVPVYIYVNWTHIRPDLIRYNLNFMAFFILYSKSTENSA